MNALRVQWLPDSASLHEHAPALARLAQDAVEPNVFHEPWLLLPALYAFAPSALSIALVWRDDGRLAALFPFRRYPRTGWMPARLGLWHHLYSFLGTPLINRDQPDDAVAALLASIERGDAPARCLELSAITAEGPFSQALARALGGRSGWTQHRDLQRRACLDLASARPPEPGISARHRKELRRQWKRLSEQGRLAFLELGAHEDAAPWLDAFLQLEASGWKGRAGTALRADDGDAGFFRQVATLAHRQGRLHMLTLALDGRPIAMQCNFLAGEGAFAFKVAFDEAYASASPGLQLELHALERLAAVPGLRWVDSCASPDHPLMNRLWTGRRVMADHWLAHGNGHARAWLSQLRVRRWLGARMRALRARGRPAD
ncbi:GNAT family N-acetyltransferase [Pseudoxanthomonas beigongshangi]